MIESFRSRILNELLIKGTPAEKVFDDIVKMASEFCHTPIALITLLDDKKQYFKAAIGTDIKETKIEDSFCIHTLNSGLDVFEVPDTLNAEFLKDNPFVSGDPGIRFYTGVTLKSSEGVGIGTLCVVDVVPRKLEETQNRMLQLLAGTITHLLQMRRVNLIQKARLNKSNTNLKVALDRLVEAQELSRLGSWDWDLRSNNFVWSKELYHLFGIDPIIQQDLDFKKWQSMIHPDDLTPLRESLRKAIKEHKKSIIEYRVNKDDGTQLWISGKSKIHLDEDGLPVRMSGTAHDITNRKKAEAEKETYTRTLEEMLFSLSHELRKPIASSLSLSKAIGDEDADLIDQLGVVKIADDFKKHVEEIDEHVNNFTKKIHEKKSEFK
jgi:PAS domain S-box-containing protein